MALNRKDYIDKKSNFQTESILDRITNLCTGEDCKLKNIGKRIKRIINLKQRLKKRLLRYIRPKEKQKIIESKPQIIHETKIIQTGTHDYSKNKTIIINENEEKKEDSERELSYIKNYPGNIIKSQHKINYDDYASTNPGFVEKNYDKLENLRRRDTSEIKGNRRGGRILKFSHNFNNKIQNFKNDLFNNRGRNTDFSENNSNKRENNTEFSENNFNKGDNYENGSFSNRGRINVTTSGNRKNEIKRVMVNSNINGDMKKRDYVFGNNDGCDKGSTFYGSDDRCALNDNGVFLRNNNVNYFRKNNIDYLGSSFNED